ncbi:MAG: class I SAM-dependent methyltransferase, partial [Nocardioides sp.]
MTESARDYWNAEAATFDDEPDHGLRDPETRAAWRALLLAQLPAAPADLVDVGCGTGTVSVLLALEGHRVRGLDVAPAMLERAAAKAAEAGVDIAFTVGDAAAPPYAAGSCDVVLSRHVLWAMPDPADAVRRWCRLLRPGGRLVLVEGDWHTGAGLSASAVASLVAEHHSSVEVVPLPEPVYWGGPITDERYLL